MVSEVHMCYTRSDVRHWLVRIASHNFPNILLASVTSQINRWGDTFFVVFPTSCPMAFQVNLCQIWGLRGASWRSSPVFKLCVQYLSQVHLSPTWSPVVTSLRLVWCSLRLSIASVTSSTVNVASLEGVAMIGGTRRRLSYFMSIDVLSCMCAKIFL